MILASRRRRLVTGLGTGTRRFIWSWARRASTNTFPSASSLSSDGAYLSFCLSSLPNFLACPSGVDITCSSSCRGLKTSSGPVVEMMQFLRTKLPLVPPCQVDDGWDALSSSNEYVTRFSVRLLVRRPRSFLSIYSHTYSHSNMTYSSLVYTMHQEHVVYARRTSLNVSSGGILSNRSTIESRRLLSGTKYSAPTHEWRVSHISQIGS